MTLIEQKSSRHRQDKAGRPQSVKFTGRTHKGRSSGKVGKIMAIASSPVGEVKVRTKVAPVKIREGLGVKQPEFARMTGYSTRSVAGWEAGQPVSPSARQKLAEMDRLREGLAGVMAVEHIGDWLTSPNGAFGGQTPLQVIERGETDRIWRMIFQLEAGVAT